MLKCLFVLSEQYRNKRIVIFGVNRNAVVAFSLLALNNQVDISYFWNPKNQFIGEYFVNRPIISTEQLSHIQNAIVIIPDIIKKDEVILYTEKEVLYIDEVLDINSELYHKNNYIYGIGGHGEKIYKKLLDKKIVIKGVCVTKPGKITNWHGYKVMPIDQMAYQDKCNVIVATDREYFQQEMLSQLADNRIDKYIVYFMNYWTIFEGNFFQVINLAITKHKNLWLYVGNSEIELYLNEVFHRYSINVYKKIWEKEIYDLWYENIDDICVVVAEKDDLKLKRICDELDGMGFGLGKWNYTATGYYILMNIAANRLSKKDVLIGNSIYENEKYPGYIVYGDEKNAKVRIMILGGSTSTDKIYRTVSWVKFLYKRLCDIGCMPFILNGAVCGQGIVDEFLHMVRDIEPIKPDCVISLSGVNDTRIRKTRNLFNIRHADLEMENNDCISGVASNESLYDFWYRISKMMNLIASEYGVKVYNFLQPMSAAKDELDLVETGMFDFTEHTEYMRYFKTRAKKEKDMFYINMMSALEGKISYIDFAHYSTESNALIADYIFDVIKSDVLKAAECVTEF